MAVQRSPAFESALAGLGKPTMETRQVIHHSHGKAGLLLFNSYRVLGDANLQFAFYAQKDRRCKRI